MLIEIYGDYISPVAISAIQKFEDDKEIHVHLYGKDDALVYTIGDDDDIEEELTKIVKKWEEGLKLAGHAQ